MTYRNREHDRQAALHHHDKHAATKDGHRPDDPHAVTNPLTNQWKAERVRFQDTDPHGEPDWKQQQLDSLMNNQVAIQSVLDEPNIQREGHEVFDEGTDYGQRVSAFGNVERNLADQQIEELNVKGGVLRGSFENPEYIASEGYPIEGDEAVDLMDGEEDQAFAKKAMYGQDLPPPPPPPPPPRQSREAEEAHIAANTQGFGPEETRTRADADKADRADVRKWQEGNRFDRKMEERTGRPSPPRPPPESRFTPEGTGPGSPQRETKTPAPPRMDGLAHQRTPSDAARAKAGPPPPPPPKRKPPPPGHPSHPDTPR
jgi:hypothetical protein